jgi:hypothetical protein
MVTYSDLPIEIINKIINYTDVVVFRNGKYINRINKNDYRYKILNKKKEPIWLGNNKWMFCFKLYDGINNRGFVMEHYINQYDNFHYLYKKEFVKHESGIFEFENIKHYVFDKEGNCRQFFNYTQ